MVPACWSKAEIDSVGALEKGREVASKPRAIVAPYTRREAPGVEDGPHLASQRFCFPRIPDRESNCEPGFATDDHDDRVVAAAAALKAKDLIEDNFSKREAYQRQWQSVSPWSIRMSFGPVLLAEDT